MAAVAQDDPSPKKRSSRLLEEVMVTAQKRSEDPQEVPISLQAFSAEKLDARGVLNQNDLQFITPSLEIGQQVSYTTIFLRGVGTDAFLTADPSVATYIDGIYFPFAQGLAQDFGAVERVEVLKGPQGTLFGRNATGGALSIVSKKPEFNEFYGDVQATWSEYPDEHYRVHVNVPVTDSIAFSASGVRSSTDFYITGTANGKTLPKDEDDGFRVKARWAPSENIDLTLSYFKLNRNGAGSNFTLNRNPTELGDSLQMQANDDFEGKVDGQTYNWLDNEVTYGELSFYTSMFDIKLLGSDQLINTSGRLDFDGTDTPTISFSPKKNFADIQTAEMQLLSNDESWGAGWMKWIVGAYYFQGLSGFDPMHGEVDAADDIYAGLGIVGDLLSAAGLGADPVTLLIRGTVETQSEAAFVQTTFNITDWFDLTLGLRHQKETRTIEKAKTTLFIYEGEEIPYLEYDYAIAQDGTRVPGEVVTESTSPKISLEFHPWEDGLIYASYQEATKSATYNVTVVTGPPTFAKPEEMEAFEIGIKTGLFDNAMTLSAAAFAYDITNLQVQFIALSNGGVASFENAELAEIRGVDFDFTWLLFPDWIDDLVWTGGGAFLDAKYAAYPDGAGYVGNSGVFTRGNDFSGNDIVRSPELTATTTLAKTFQFENSNIEVAIDYYYNSGFYYESANLARSEQEAYDKWGARLSYFYEPESLRVTLFGKNLTDTVYSQGAFPNDFGDNFNYAAPRVLGVRVNYEF
ncbi:TonB-dependent receptor [Spongiibacter taiwanensis]